VAQDGMPLEDWDNDHLQEAVKSLYDATALAHTLSALRQDIAYTPFGTSFKYEDLPEQQQVILAQIQSLEPNMFGHLVAQMIANPNNPVHVPDLPPLKNMLDPMH